MAAMLYEFNCDSGHEISYNKDGAQIVVDVNNSTEVIYLSRQDVEYLKENIEYLK